MSRLEIPTPATIALPIAEQMVTGGLFDVFKPSHEEQKAIITLENDADSFGMLDKDYFVEAGRMFSMPVSFEADELVRYDELPAISFEGRLVSYSTLRVGRIIGANAVRALCLAFHKVTLLPFLIKSPTTTYCTFPLLP